MRILSVYSHLRDRLVGKTGTVKRVIKTRNQIMIDLDGGGQYGSFAYNIDFENAQGNAAPEAETTKPAGTKQNTVAPAPERGYTEDEKNANYALLAKSLRNGNSNLTVDGLRYIVGNLGDFERPRWYGIIVRANGHAISNARDRIYASPQFESRKKAVEDLLAVARNNFYPNVQDDKAPIGTKEGYNEQEGTHRDGNASEETKQNGAGSRTLQETSEGILRQDAVLRGARERLSPDFGQSPIRTWADGHIVVPVEGSVAYQEQQMTMGYGVPSFVVDDAVWGKNEGAVPSFSVNGQIYFKETIPEKLRGMLAPHELTHVMKQMDYHPYMDFVKRTAGMLDMTSDEAQVLLEAPAKHRKIDVFGADQKLDMEKIKVLSEADALKLYDELNATLYGHIGSGKLDGLNKYLDKAFYDFNAYATELKSIHDWFRAAQAKATVAQIPQQKIADEVRKLIEDGIAFTNTRLFEIANKAYGGTMAEGKYTVKDAYDGVELGVNQYLVQADFVKKGNGNAASARVTLKKLQRLLAKLPTQTKRTDEQLKFQQFSAPPNIAYIAAWAANISENDVALEPSAGIGEAYQ